MAYLSLIPAFAVLYTFLPDDFYHTTVQYENTFSKEKSEISTMLEQEIIKTFKKFHKADKASFSGWSIDANSFSLRSFRITNADVKFELDLELKSADESQGPIYTAPTVSLPVLGWIESVNSSDSGSLDDVSEYKPIVLQSTIPLFSTENSAKAAFEKILFPAPPPAPKKFPPGLGYESQQVQGAFIPIPRSLNKRIIDLEKAIQGFPSSIKGTFWRMLYFSAVTVTTVGYGDILPLTTRSRIFVTCEAVLGIVLIGLFLNAIANDRAK